ncbi:Hpt domain-containing protein [Devosia sp. A16]|uniref:Hpt domain-containing protein n=1 Tax=Devosia sp. A16 TaxID=1736675 RepID=UPI0009EB2E7C|nr:Hpt domain-containing protein [Devosia sp. A16]
MVRNIAVDAGAGSARQDVSRTPIDMDHLDQQSLGDPGLRDEVLRLYAQMSGVYLGRIEASTSIPLLLEHLHTLKSAAAGIGAWTVRDLAKRAEDALRTGAPVNPEHIQQIAAAVAECQAFIAKLISAEES